MKILLSINKKVIALLLSFLVILSSFSLIYTSKVSADTTSRSTNTKMMYQDPFTASGSHIVATKSIAGTDIKKGYSMATSYINDNYMKKVYCLNMGNHPYTSKLDSTTGGDWGKFDWRKKEAIGNIIALGLSGNMKGSADNYGTSKNPKYYKVISNVTSYPINNKAVKYHRTYSNTKYGKGTFSDSEIYIACQLLVWEITKGYRKTSSLNKTSKSLVEAYSNKNVRTVYNFIANRIYYINKTPSFTVDNKKDPKLKEYNFDVTYDAKKKKYSFSPSVLKMKSSTKGVLKYYTDLANNRSVSFKDTAGNTKYLNINANISGDTLTLTPKSVTSTVPKNYSKGNLAYSQEKELPTGSDEKLEIKNNIIAYMPSKGELENGQNQVGAPKSCWIDPKKAYYKVSADYSTTNINRDFSIQKDMRIKSETSESGYKSDNSSLDCMEEGYYYYVKLPTGNETYTVVEDGKLVTKKSDCQNSATALGLKTSDICYNKTLKEYYVIVGPTNSEGVTKSISSYIAKYVKSGINKSSTPYGNYYAFELGKADTSKGWKKTTAINSSTSDLLDMNPDHYTIPDNVEPYHFSYEEHLAIKDSDEAQDNDLLAIRKGINTYTTKGKIAYYNRLKRIYRGPNATSLVSPTYVNLTSIRIRLHKIADDNVVGRILFKIEKKSNNNWVNLDITNYIKDKSYMSYLTDFSNGQFMTYQSTVESIGREKGYSPYLSLPAGDYMITELGHYADNGKLEFRDYLVKPDPIEFNIGDDDSVIDEYVENNTVEYEVENTSTVQLRLFKKGNDGIPLNGAEYELYNENGNLLTTLKTGTMNIDDVKYDGVAVADYMRLNKKYTVKEVKAPAGYLLDNTVYEIKFTQLDLKNQKDGTYRNHYDVTLTDKPTSAYVTKTDITGSEELSGAKLVLKKGDEVIDTWTSSTEPHKIYGLVFGTEYTLSETISPDGYATTESITFTYSEDGQTVTMYDDTTKYQFIKQDDLGNTLANAKLQLSDEVTKEVVDEWTTTTSPYIVSKLTVGKTYRLKELSAPSPRYKLADDIVFTVRDTPELQTIIMTDEIYRGSVTLQKQDEQGNNLGGSEYELYTKDGNQLSLVKLSDGTYSTDGNGTDTTLVTNNDGKLVVKNLEIGDYYFVETKAPDNRMIYSDKINFTITSDSDDTLNPSVTVLDDKVIYPNTGGYGYGVPVAIAISIIVVALALLLISNRKTKKEKENNEKN